MRGGGYPARPQDRGNIEKQHIPKSHFTGKLFYRVGATVGIEARGIAAVHKITSIAGIN